MIYAPGPWVADGSGFYLLTDEGRSFRGLAFYDLAAGGYDWVETPDGDIEEVALSADGRVLAWFVNVDGWEQLKLRDLESGQDLPDQASVRRAPTTDRLHVPGRTLSGRLARRGHPFRPPTAAEDYGLPKPTRETRVRSQRADSACCEEGYSTSS